MLLSLYFRKLLFFFLCCCNFYCILFQHIVLELYQKVLLFLFSSTSPKNLNPSDVLYVMQSVRSLFSSTSPMNSNPYRCLACINILVSGTGTRSLWFRNSPTLHAIQTRNEEENFWRRSKKFRNQRISIEISRSASWILPLSVLLQHLGCHPYSHFIYLLHPWCLYDVGALRS